MTRHADNVQGGCACECPRVGVFVIFWRADDVTRTMSKGGGACECLDPPPPSGNPVSAPVLPQPGYGPDCLHVIS